MASPQPTLSAAYTSITNVPFTVSLPQNPPASSTSTASKSAYLSALRTSVAALQAEVNRELTARMDEDKVRDATTAAASGKKVVDDEKDEENYGEEVQEEDE
ncbi:EKC/KEOPS complex subunit GON7 [Staphylotrichum tortipilum]|uniref:EKC/KEOPS complex subunit GON7 n=1 Tax=Staphylotrichum tortipilum TaxID=2831512 RepID=A0AAN6MJP7_9PEZI|nr:EKC/KEOPS complex subunit GON7 [Staphylotrichum longicolle]